MRFMAYENEELPGLAVFADNEWWGLAENSGAFPGRLEELIGGGDEVLRAAASTLRGRGLPLRVSEIKVLPPLRQPGKIICIGLNYADHTKEISLAQPDYPAVFTRFSSTLVGAGGAVVLPSASIQLDYEGELVAVIGKKGRKIPKGEALLHVAGWSIFNDVSLRDYQFKTSQWTVGKNFDATGPFGPEFVTADELPAGGAGLMIETRLNGQIVQHASTSDLIFDVPTLISTLSEVMTLECSDLIVTGTPSGVGAGRKPPLWMKVGDVVEVEIERLGVLRNPIVAA